MPTFEGRVPYDRESVEIYEVSAVSKLFKPPLREMRKQMDIGFFIAVGLGSFVGTFLENLLQRWEKRKAERAKRDEECETPTSKRDEP